MAHRTAVSYLVLLVVLVPAAGASEPGREFTSTAVIETAEGTRRMPVTLVIDRFTPAEEAAGLRAVLESGGQGALLGALRGRSDGRIALGALQMPLALVVAEPVDDGYEYVFLTPRTIDVGEVESGSGSLDYPFGIATFELGDFGRGEGVLYVAAALSIAEDGDIDVAGWHQAPGRLLDVKKVR